jgi:hypothetical protein
VIQCIILTGDITISGDGEGSVSDTAIQLDGVGLEPTDTSVNTTVTDRLMRPSSITDDWETQSQADPTGFHVNVKETDDSAVQQSGGNLLVKSDGDNELAEKRTLLGP